MQTEEELNEKREKKFRQLSEEWRVNAMAKPTTALQEDITKKCARIVELNNLAAMDPDLSRIKEEKKVAEAPYKEGKREAGLEVEFMLYVLQSRGEKVASAKTVIKNAVSGV